MLRYYIPELLKCFAAFCGVIIAIAYTAYKINSRRELTNPKKRYYHPLAVVLAPITFLVCVPPAIVFFILAALLYAGFLIFFAFLLIIIRQSFLLVWWNKFSLLVGEPLLRIGTYLILLPFRILRPPRGSGQRPLPA